MIGDRRVSIAALKTRIGNLLDRRIAVAPFRVHLQIAAVLLERGAGERGIQQNAADLRAAQKVPPKLTSSLNIRPPIAARDRAVNRWRLASVQDLADDSCGTGSNAGDFRQGAGGADKIGQRY